MWPQAPLLRVFYRDGQVVGGPQGFPQLLVPAVGVSHSGHYSCEVRCKVGAVWRSSTRLRFTVRSECGDGHWEPPQPPRIPCLGPPQNPLIPRGRGRSWTLSGQGPRPSASLVSPQGMPWPHPAVPNNGQEVARGPFLELGDIDVGHSGTYQCVATNQLGQDGHRVFRALSPELALEVTPGSPWVTVAAGVGGALLFLLLLVGVIVAWHRWHRVAARKHQERVPPDPPAPPEEGEVLYSHVVVTKGTGGSPHATTLQDPQVTYAELWGHQGQPREPGDIYGNVL
ncbi:uncharacterized protein LOC120511779 [Passer montanus]|uniref:uncharacterized protein LOC120511779 n=1 Tax=Passer montanus TaxID=9160 RepID=UPI001961A263|nr:uncharacterized protein LOC120511779 [Passer montanus]